MTVRSQAILTLSGAKTFHIGKGFTMPHAATPPQFPVRISVGTQIPWQRFPAIILGSFLSGLHSRERRFHILYDSSLTNRPVTRHYRDSATEIVHQWQAICGPQPSAARESCRTHLTCSPPSERRVAFSNSVNYTHVVKLDKQNVSCEGLHTYCVHKRCMLVSLQRRWLKLSH